MRHEHKKNKIKSPKIYSVTSNQKSLYGNTSYFIQYLSVGNKTIYLFFMTKSTYDSAEYLVIKSIVLFVKVAISISPQQFINDRYIS